MGMVVQPKEERPSLSFFSNPLLSLYFSSSSLGFFFFDILGKKT